MNRSPILTPVWTFFGSPPAPEGNYLVLVLSMQPAMGFRCFNSCVLHVENKRWWELWELTKIVKLCEKKPQQWAKSHWNAQWGWDLKSWRWLSEGSSSLQEHTVHAQAAIINIKLINICGHSDNCALDQPAKPRCWDDHCHHSPINNHHLITTAVSSPNKSRQLWKIKSDPLSETFFIMTLMRVRFGRAGDEHKAKETEGWTHLWKSILVSAAFTNKYICAYSICGTLVGSSYGSLLFGLGKLIRRPRPQPTEKNKDTVIMLGFSESVIFKRGSSQIIVWEKTVQFIFSTGYWYYLLTPSLDEHKFFPSVLVDKTWEEGSRGRERWSADPVIGPLHPSDEECGTSSLCLLMRFPVSIVDVRVEGQADCTVSLVNPYRMPNYSC